MSRAPQRVGLDPLLFSGHSLRAGFLTSAAKRGVSIFKMMDVSRHRSVDTLRGYVREAEIFKDHAGTGLLQSSTTFTHNFMSSRQKASSERSITACLLPSATGG
jgi:hypothetical protein